MREGKKETMTELKLEKGGSSLSSSVTHVSFRLHSLPSPSSVTSLGLLHECAVTATSICLFSRIYHVVGSAYKRERVFVFAV